MESAAYHMSCRTLATLLKKPFYSVVNEIYAKGMMQMSIVDHLDEWSDSKCHRFVKLCVKHCPHLSSLVAQTFANNVRAQIPYNSNPNITVKIPSDQRFIMYVLADVCESLVTRGIKSPIRALSALNDVLAQSIDMAVLALTDPIVSATAVEELRKGSQTSTGSYFISPSMVQEDEAAANPDDAAAPGGDEAKGDPALDAYVPQGLDPIQEEEAPADGGEELHVDTDAAAQSAPNADEDAVVIGEDDAAGDVPVLDESEDGGGDGEAADEGEEYDEQEEEEEEGEEAL